MVKPKENIQNATFWFFLVSLLFLRLFWLTISPIPLYGDEAQYWVWSKSLDFGYYSKPPMVAWLIALSTKLFCDSEAAIRFFSPLLHFGTSLIIYKISTILFKDKTLAVWSALGYLTLPSVFLSSCLMSTDPILLFIWALSLLAFIIAIKKNTITAWIILGIVSGLGLLTKYNMAIFAVSVLFYDWKLIKNPKLWIGGFVAFLIWLPNLLWNYNHYFVSFSHTADLVEGDKNWFSPQNFLKFTSAQLGVFGPILFISLVAQLFSKNKNSELKLLSSFTIPFLVIILSVSFFSRAHANWAAPAYISGTILATYFLYKNYYKILNASFILHLVIGIVAMISVYTIEISGYYTTFDPLKRLRGYKEIALQLKELHPAMTVVADDRMVLSLLTYYCDIPVYKWNTSRRIKDHFDLRDEHLSLQNKDLLLVSNYYTKIMLQNYGTTVENYGELQYGNRNYRLILIKNFKGYK